MSVIRIKTFGGLRPSASSRALGADDAQVNRDLMPRISEFRPLLKDQLVATSPVMGAKTIYRPVRNADGSFNDDVTTGWRAHASLLNIAKGQINDDRTDRTFITFADGSDRMRALDVTGQDRLVGVPQPTAAPVATVTAVDELTYEERAAGYSAALEQAVKVLEAGLREKWVGIQSPGTGTPGLLDIKSDYVPFEDRTRVGRVFRLVGAGGAISATYSSAAPESMSWVMDPMLKGEEVAPFTNAPAWAGAFRHFGVALHAYGLGYSLDRAATIAALTAIELPGGEKLLLQHEAESLCDFVEGQLDDSQGVVRVKREALVSKFNEVLTLFAGGARSNLIAATQAFYSRPEISAQINEAIEAFASEVFKQARQVFLTPIPAPPYNPGDLP